MRILIYGLGAIGLECARAVARTPGLTLAGAVDLDPAKIGRPLRSLIGAPSAKQPHLPATRIVAATLGEALRKGRADVVIHTTQSSLEATWLQLAECAAAGLPIVSSTEELSYPRAVAPRLAAKLDSVARRHKVAILGTGVNPGFVMDLLPIVASGATRNVRRIRVERILDAGKRRTPFQRKVCVGRSPAEARRQLSAGGGHVGLELSAALISEGCGLPFDTIRSSGSPVIARRPLRCALGTIAVGQVAGLKQSVRCLRAGRTVISLDMVMAVGADDPHDAAIIEGDPPVHLRAVGGIFGDSATVATLLNAIPRVVAATPGLHTILDLPVPRTWTPRPR